MKKRKTRIELPTPRIAGPHGMAIDWGAWMAEASQPRGIKGKKLSAEIRAKFSAAQKARFAKHRAQLACALAAQRAAEAAVPKVEVYDPLATVRQTDKLLGALEPGKWYATPDMRDVSGVNYGTCKAWAVLWWREGILQRVQNPEWKPPDRPGAWQAVKWLYALTDKGAEARRLAAALL